MYDRILLAVALQHWERYSAHALAARDVALGLAKTASNPLHVLTVYDYPSSSVMPLALGFDLGSSLGGEEFERYEESQLDEQVQTDRLMQERLNDYVSPLEDAGIEVARLSQVGNPRTVIEQTITRLGADLLIIGSHSKRGRLDIALGGTAQWLTRHAPCALVLVSPEP